MIKALHVSPDVFATITKALIDHEAGGGRHQLSENVGLDILWLNTPLSKDDAERVASSTQPIPVVIMWGWRYQAEVVEE